MRFPRIDVAGILLRFCGRGSGVKAYRKKGRTVSGAWAIWGGDVLDLPKASFGEDTLGVDVGDFLDRTTLSRSAMFGGDDATIGTLAEFFDELVLGVDYEGRVEGGERVSLHRRRCEGRRWW